MSRRRKLEDVCRKLDLQPYVVGFWRTEFPALVALGRDSGANELGEEEVLVVQRIRELLYDEGFTIDQARATIDSEFEQGGLRGRTATAPPPAPEEQPDDSSGPPGSSPAAAVEVGTVAAPPGRGADREPAVTVLDAASAVEGTDGQDIGTLTRRVERLEGGVAALVSQARQLAAELKPDPEGAS